MFKTQLKFEIKDCEGRISHDEQNFAISDNSTHDVILLMSWLNKVNPQIDFTNGKIRMLNEIKLYIYGQIY
jgi:hypothetical protein